MSNFGSWALKGYIKDCQRIKKRCKKKFKAFQNDPYFTEKQKRANFKWLLSSQQMFWFTDIGLKQSWDIGIILNTPIFVCFHDK